MGVQRVLKVRTYGSFDVKWSDGTAVDIRGAKVRALFLMLVTSPHGSHARGMLQSTLWEGANLAQAQASLRRALSDLRAVFGEDFESLFEVDSYTVGIKLDQIEQVGSTKSGIFLEGLNVRGTQFQKWLDARRAANKKAPPARALRPANSVLPSLAVMPLRGISPDHSDASFADYLTAGLTRGLAQRRYFDVISHLSGRLLDVKSDSLVAMREALDVDFLVYGTIIEADGKYQLKVDCADAATGNVLWSGGINGRKSALLEDREDNLNELVRQIAGALLHACSTYAQSAPLPNIPVPTLLLSARSLMHQSGREGFLKAKLQLDTLVKRAPDHVLFRALRCRWHMDAIAQLWSDDPQHNAYQAAKDGADCAELNPRCLHGLVVNGHMALSIQGDLATANDQFEEALHIDPYHAGAMAGLAGVYVRMGERDLAIEQASQARAAAAGSPLRHVYDYCLAETHLTFDEYDAAAKHASVCLEGHRYHLGAHCVLVQALHGLGRGEEATRAGRSLMTRHPRFSFERFSQRQALLHADQHRDAKHALCDHGVPEGRTTLAES
ncbi:MAG: tetratricopeptide repeat protein [Ahrensia sp.]